VTIVLPGPTPGPPSTPSPDARNQRGVPVEDRAAGRDPRATARGVSQRHRFPWWASAQISRERPLPGTVAMEVGGGGWPTRSVPRDRARCLSSQRLVLDSSGGGTEVDGAVGELGVAEVDVAANVSLGVVSKRLGHSSISLTADTCSYLFQGVDRWAAEAAAALVGRQVPYQLGQKRAPRAKEFRRVRPQKCRAARGNAVGPVGLEPTTCGLKVPPRT
jgi:hypothetical protein